VNEEDEDDYQDNIYEDDLNFYGDEE